MSQSPKLALVVALSVVVVGAFAKNERTSAQTPPQVPVGSVLAHAGTSPPEGYLLADGRLLGTDVQYQALCSVVGKAYNRPNDNVSACRLPDLRGRAVIAAGNYDDPVLGATTRTRGEVIGAASQVLQEAETPVRSHRHRTAGAWHPEGAKEAGGLTRFQSASLQSGGALGSYWEYDGSWTTMPDGAAPVTPHSVMQPSLVLSYVIKY